MLPAALRKYKKLEPACEVNHYCSQESLVSQAKLAITILQFLTCPCMDVIAAHCAVRSDDTAQEEMSEVRKHSFDIKIAQIRYKIAQIRCKIAQIRCKIAKLSRINFLYLILADIVTVKHYELILQPLQRVEVYKKSMKNIELTKYFSFLFHGFLHNPDCVPQR